MNITAKETLETMAGAVDIYHIGHGSVRLEYNGKVIQVDPYSEVADYAKQPKADLVLITHDHYDHYDEKALKPIVTTSTVFITSTSVAQQMKTDNKITVLKYGESTTWNGIKVTAVPAYNLKHMKPDNTPFHPKGYGNGYLLEIGGKTIYFAGDTEYVPEMTSLKNKVDVAFLPKNLPYTMDDEMFIRAAKSIEPKILYPYHYGEVSMDKLAKELEGTKIQLKLLPIEK